jgi:hypothetical protein
MQSNPHLPFVSLLLVATSAGCANFDDLGSKLGNPEKDDFETPGRLMAEGNFQDITIEGTNTSGAYIVAVRDDKRLMAKPFGEGEACFVGPYAGYGPLLKRPSEDTTAPADHLLRAVLLQATDTEPTRLVFADLDCKLAEVSFETPFLPISYSFSKEGDILVLDAAETLWNVNPWSQTKEKVADKVSALSGNGTRAVFGRGTDGDAWMYTLEGGEIVARDKSFEEVFRASEDVEEIYYHVDSEGEVILGIRRGGTWTGLSVDDPDEEFMIAENSCGFRIAEGKLGREAYYFECGTNALMLYRFKGEERHLLAENVRDYRTFGKASDGPVLMYRLLDEVKADDIGPVYARWGLQTPSFLGETTNFRLSSLDDTGTQNVVNDWRVEDGVASGVLKVGKVGETLKTVAKGVVSVSSRDVIHDYDGSNGVFSRRSGDLGTKLTTIHESVCPDRIRVDDERGRMLMITDYDRAARSGDLTLVENDEPTLLIRNSLPGAYQFSGNENLISVLTDYDEEKRGFTLNMARTNRPEAISIDDGVQESLEIPWPQKGLLYAVATKGRAGLYFSVAE